ncbi:MAG: hypothetical protein AB7F75_04700 [Planctomycetota bacterium]
MPFLPADWIALAMGLGALGLLRAWPRAGILLGSLALTLALRRLNLSISTLPLSLGLVWASRGSKPLKRLAFMGLNLSVFFLGAEGFLWAADRGLIETRLFYKEKWPDGVPYDSDSVKVLGHCPTPGKSTRCLSYLHSDTLDWEALYTIDAEGRRLTVGQPPKEKGQDTIALVGCSNTFGHGVNDDETIASVLQTRVPQRVENLGVNAYGPSEVLNLLKGLEPRFHLDPEAKVKDVVYFFIPHHFYRHPFSPSWNYRLSEGALFYRLKDGGIEPFVFSRPPSGDPGAFAAFGSTFWNQHTRLSKFTRLPPPQGEVDPAWVELTARLVCEMRRVCSEPWGARFHMVVLGYHDQVRHEENIRALIEKLASRGVDVWDFRHLCGDVNDPVNLDAHFDITSRHLTALHARKVGQELAQRLTSQH